MPGERSGVYKVIPDAGVISLTDTLPHAVRIDVFDAAGNSSQLRFAVQYTPNFFKSPYNATEQLIPNEVNVFERPNFELYTTELAMYDTVNIIYSELTNVSPGSVSAKHVFLNPKIPVHDSITVRLKVNAKLTDAGAAHLVIVNKFDDKEIIQKAAWNRGWVSAQFRQFGNFQAFVDTIAPTVNAPGIGDTINLTHATRLVYNPKDNFKKVKSLKAELDGQWLLLTNDKNLAFIYQFDDYFLPGVHQLKLTAEDMAGNVTEKTWWVRRQ